MKIGTILRAINKHAAIYFCLAAFFAFCWLFHYAASVRMEACDRQFAVMNDETLRAMALIDWVAAHSWMAWAFVSLDLASIAFLQIRGRPPWTCWLIAAVYCIPCIAYWKPCAYIMLKLF